MNRVLILGAAGFIGSNLSYKLSQLGHDITLVDDLSNGCIRFLDNIECKEIIQDDFVCEKVMNKINNQEFDYVFHLAALPRVLYSVYHPAETTDVNINKTVKLLEVCRGNIKRFIFSSSSSVYGGADILPTPEYIVKKPKSPYALQKSVIEDYLQLFWDLYEFDSVNLRYFNVFGPNQLGNNAYACAISSWCNAVKYNLPLRSDDDGEQSRDLCYVDNVVQANILAMEKDDKLMAKAYNVACGDRITNNNILNYFKERFPKIKIHHAPRRAGDVKHTQANIDKISEELNYKVKVKFWEGLEKTIQWWEL